MSQIVFDPQKFSGRARLFPLPNLVLFPHVMQPMHVFEPRYQALLADCLADDRLFALAVLGENWQQHYEGRPPVHPVACLVHVATHHPLGDGRSNILVVGVQRVRVLQETPSNKPYREARVELLSDDYPPAGAAAREPIRRRLLESFERILPKTQETSEQLQVLLGQNLSLGMLTDIIGYTLQLDLADKLKLLSEPDVDRRAALLLECFAQFHGPTGRPALARKFPPDFSDN